MKRRFIGIACLIMAWTSNVCANGYDSYNQGVEAWKSKNYIQAREYWGRSIIEGGPDEAFNNLGYLWYYGMGGNVDSELGVELWRKASILSVSEAQWHLGDAYEQGQGVQKDVVLAYAWYKCAIATASQLNDSILVRDAQKSLNKLTSKISPQEQKEAEKLAQIFITKYSVPMKLSQKSF